MIFPLASVHGTEAAREAAAVVRAGLRLQAPTLGIILGSGLGGVSRRLRNARRLPFAEVPGFPRATVVGHSGELIAGELSGREIVAFSGRFHIYEGHPATLAGFPTRVLHALGVDTMLASNAAGGVRPPFEAGDLMIIRDHINLLWSNPLIGALEPGDERFPDMSTPYDPQLRAHLAEAMRAVGLVAREGVYAASLGPAYETPAEVRMLQTLGADAVGMSTVPEVLVARARGMRVVGLSCITNLAAGRSTHTLTHTEVIETAKRVEQSVADVVERFVARI